MAKRHAGPVRRHLPLILLLVLAVWIVLIIVLITVHPTSGGGNPMG
ncbi:hypothetical protein KZZ52_43735 [Dactylosporangium sp. AC04546]|nr:hypothetical protein [Dactylosporangium sp. AC04546]WVK80827.1 hypothetical protein KZZ52_43735 [Dactylosporangium sp. AC04546]